MYTSETKVVHAMRIVLSFALVLAVPAGWYIVLRWVSKLVRGQGPVTSCAWTLFLIIFLGWVFLSSCSPQPHPITKRWALIMDLVLFVGWAAMLVFFACQGALHVANAFAKQEARPSSWLVIASFVLLLGTFVILDLKGRLPVPTNLSVREMRQVERHLISPRFPNQ